MFTVGEVGLVYRRGLLELPEVAVARLLFLPWLYFSFLSRVRGSCARCQVLSLEFDGGVGVVGDIVG